MPGNGFGGVGWVVGNEHDHVVASYALQALERAGFQIAQPNCVNPVSCQITVIPVDNGQIARPEAGEHGMGIGAQPDGHQIVTGADKIGGQPEGFFDGFSRNPAVGRGGNAAGNQGHFDARQFLQTQKIADGHA